MPTLAAALELNGRVVDANGAPVAEALVELQPVLPFLERSLEILEGETKRTVAVSARTSTDGEYRLTVPEGGMWQVEVSAAAKVPTRCRLLPFLESETLPDAVLEPDAGLEVRVEDDAGSPLAGAQVWVQPDETERRRSRRPWSSLWSPGGGYGRTGQDGRVKLARRAEQKVSVHAFAQGHLPGEKADLDTAKTTLRLTPGKPVTLRVRAASGEPVSKAVLTVSSLNWVAAATDQNGEAFVSVTPGEALLLKAWRATGQVEVTELQIPTEALDSTQETVHEREWRLPEPIELSGTVLDKDTREPLRKALVWTSEDPGAFQLSDADGRFTLVRRMAQRWYLQAAAVGYGFTRAEAQQRPDGPRVPTLALARAGSITGRVIDPQGEAIADAVVRVTSDGQIVMARSDADGAFRLDGLTAERPYELSAEADGFAPEARSVTLEPGRSLDIVLHPGRTLIGRLVTPEREPIAGGRIYLTPVESDPRVRGFLSRNDSPPRAESDVDGRFRLDGLPQGLMALLARKDGMADKVLPDVDLTPGEAPLDLGDIELDWGVELRGRVRSQTGEPIEGAVLMVFGGFFGTAMISNLGDEPPSEITTDAQGRFVLGGLTRGVRYNASVRHENYVDEFLSEIDPGASEPLEIVLERGATVSGRVLDDARVPVERVNVMVRTVARDKPPTSMMERGTPTRRGYSGADGSFEVTGISPGRIEVAVAPGRGWIASELLAITVTAGEERRDVVLRVTTGAELTGRVTDRAGRPVVGAAVRVTGSRRSVSGFGAMGWSDETRAHGETDGDGSYALAGLDPAVEETVISVHHPDFATLEQPLELRPGSNRLDLVLQEGASLSGVVMTGTGEPVEGARITIAEGASSLRMVSMRGDLAAESGPDGTFELKGLGSGVFQVQAIKTGFAASAAQQVEIGEGPGDFVTLTLLLGGTIRGRILGLEPDELGQVMVVATDQARGMAMGLVGDDGQFRIPNVGFSEGAVMASSQRTGQMVRAEFTLDTRGGETWLDLEFGTGSSLTGVVLLNGEPLAQAIVVAQGAAPGVGGASGTSMTDTSGRFRMSGLEDGPHRLMVMMMGSVNHSETVSVQGDTELTIEISNVRVSGRVLAKSTGEPVAGAQVWASVENEALAGFGGARTEATAAGEFEIFVPAGNSVVLRAKAPDFAEASIELNTGQGGALAGLELLLPPGAGLELNVTLWNGARPELASTALVDANGVQVLADAVMARPAGKFRLASAPPGDWILLLTAEESAVLSVPVTVPGPPVEVVLPQAAKISIEVADRQDGFIATKARLVSPSGQVLRFPIMGQVFSEWPLFGSGSEIPFVPAGTWTLELIADTGAVRSQAVTAVAGEVVRVVFE